MIYQLGLLPGECEYKAAPGIDWSSILSINVYGDGETRETVYKKELKPYFNAVLTRSRMAVKQEQPRPLHVWTEANHRSYSNPLRLPSPTIVEDAYSSIDVPSPYEDELSIKIGTDWNTNVRPIELRFKEEAANLFPANGILPLDDVNAQHPVKYRGLRWHGEQSVPLEAELVYQLNNRFIGKNTVELEWGRLNTIDLDSVPSVLIVPESLPPGRMEAIIEVYQGIDNLEQVVLKDSSGKIIYLLDSPENNWMRTRYIDRRNKQSVSGKWQKLESGRTKIQWPEYKKIRLSLAPDVEPDISVWILNELQETCKPKIIELGAFSVSEKILVMPGDDPCFYLALATEDDRNPPEYKEKFWIKQTKTKLKLNSLLLNKLR